jgi:hypothetical protein
MMEIIVPFIIVVRIVLTKLSVLRPSVLVILDERTHFLSGLINLPLKVSETEHLFFFFWTYWWMASRSLISWSNSSSWGVGLVAFLFWLLASRNVSWLTSSGWSAAPGPNDFFGGMTKVRACRRWSSEFTHGGRQCWSLVLKCYELRTRQHKC